MKKKWKLDPKEVGTNRIESTSACPGGKRGPRLKRAELILIHLPSKVQVSGLINSIIVPKKQWRKIYQDTWDQLFLELEKKVAEFLRIPRRN